MRCSSSEPLNSNFLAMGYGSMNLLYNMDTLFWYLPFFLVLYFFLYLFSFLAKKHAW